MNGCEEKGFTEDTLHQRFICRGRILVRGARSQASSTVKKRLKGAGLSPPLLVDKGHKHMGPSRRETQGKIQELRSLATSIPCIGYKSSKISSQVLLQDNQARSSNKILQYSFFLLDENLFFSLTHYVSEIRRWLSSIINQPIYRQPLPFRPHRRTASRDFSIVQEWLPTCTTCRA